MTGSEAVRVVLTGLGAVSPCGLDVPSTWAAMLAGRSGIAPIQGFDASALPVRFAGELPGYDPARHFSAKEGRRLERFIQLALVASDEAVRDAGLDPAVPLGERAGVYIGSGIGGVVEISEGSVRFAEEGIRGLSPFFIPRVLPNLAAGQVAIRHGIKGPSLCVSTACAAGNHSIGEAWRLIRCGDADLVLAGGTESAISPVGIAGFAVMRALSRNNDAPEQASRPFDKDRDGFVMGEGAGVVVLESEAHALARGARIYAELAGYGLTTDAHHITAPPPGHEGAARCMRVALRSAGMAPEEVGYINAHGTSTPANDRAETEAIHQAFGDHARRLLVSSTKSMTGHLLGAAGGLEAVITALAVHHGRVPPTINLDEPGEGCDLDYVAGASREVSLEAAVSNAFGFGGTNAVLVFRRYDGP